jgi:hypothetical protein
LSVRILRLRRSSGDQTSHVMGTTPG